MFAWNAYIIAHNFTDCKYFLKFSSDFFEIYLDNPYAHDYNVYAIIPYGINIGGEDDAAWKNGHRKRLIA